MSNDALDEVLYYTGEAQTYIKELEDELEKANDKILELEQEIKDITN